MSMTKDFYIEMSQVGLFPITAKELSECREEAIKTVDEELLPSHPEIYAYENRWGELVNVETIKIRHLLLLSDHSEKAKDIIDRVSLICGVEGI